MKRKARRASPRGFRSKAFAFAPLLFFLVAVAACGGGGGERKGLSDVAHDPTLKGPFPVGVKTLVFVDESRYDRPSKGNRWLTTEVWYPAAESSQGEASTTVIDFIPQKWRDTVRTAFRVLIGEDAARNLDAPTGAVRDAPINKVEGPYPLVGFSHGNGGVRFQNFTQCEHLASHGFVVYAPDHTGNAVVSFPNDALSILNPLLIPKSFFDRVLDMKFLTDRFMELGKNDPGGFFGGVVKEGPVGVMGHSFGGTTAMALPAFDPRVAATFPMAGVYIPVLMKPLAIPAVILYAAEDRTIGEYGIFMNKMMYSLSGPPKVLIGIPDAGHYTFSDACSLLPMLFGNDGCGQGVRYEDGSTFDFIPQQDGFAIMNSYAVALFGWVLKGQPEMLDFLMENHFPSWMDYESSTSG